MLFEPLIGSDVIDYQDLKRIVQLCYKGALTKSEFHKQGK